MALRFDEEAFEELASEVGFCLENIRHPDCELKYAGRFYEQAAECLRAHAILRLLIDAKPEKFSSDLVMSGQARRAFLRRCSGADFANYYTARSRTGSLHDAMAADDFELAAEISRLSPDDFRPGDEYEDDFCYQHYLGMRAQGVSDGDREKVLERFSATASDATASARLGVCLALEKRSSQEFGDRFEDLLHERSGEIAKDGAAEEDLAVAIGTKIFVEGVALLKLARRLGISIASEYRLCPGLAVDSGPPVRPHDEFAAP